MPNENKDVFSTPEIENLLATTSISNEAKQDLLKKLDEQYQLIDEKNVLAAIGAFNTAGAMIRKANIDITSLELNANIDKLQHKFVKLAAKYVSEANSEIAANAVIRFFKLNADRINYNTFEFFTGLVTQTLIADLNHCQLYTPIKKAKLENKIEFILEDYVLGIENKTDPIFDALAGRLIDKVEPYKVLSEALKADMEHQLDLEEELTDYLIKNLDLAELSVEQCISTAKNDLEIEETKATYIKHVMMLDVQKWIATKTPSEIISIDCDFIASEVADGAFEEAKRKLNFVKFSPTMFSPKATVAPVIVNPQLEVAPVMKL